ncbi:uncharacterized protein BDR25DRAFT_373803 [Lindgomyces ingoldianus]|uniref:Uncharacterized protein n=1 Tax=Lindgomyces ingoldianus TaxID=673940 RepID=A0ACB6QMG5_9PLEO|nr:uncharacterized protein BDR25DRAFT_373803 [Lindgomyces ingoldianus]KAF2468159.1 hypothetical protein BDR25DRAFT_373803 [Lindgomyces ingoldianus]
MHPACQLSYRPPSPVTLTWNVALNRILSSTCISKDVVEAVRQRMAETNLVNNDHSKGSFALAVNIGLVPNFSRPIVGAPFYDRHAAISINSDGRESESKAGPSTQELPNGVVLSRRSSSSGSSIRPSGFPNGNESVGYTLLPPSHPDTPVSPQTQIQLHEDTITTQAKLIRKLHKIVDRLRNRNEQLEDHLLPQLSRWLESKTMTIDAEYAIIEDLKREITDLKIAVDFSNKVLGGCWVREWELWRWTGELRRKRRKRRTGFWPRFRLTRDERTMISLSKTELDVIVSTLEQNLKILKEDVEEMVELVQGCKRQYATGIQEVEDDYEQRKDTVREV